MCKHEKYHPLTAVNVFPWWYSVTMNFLFVTIFCLAIFEGYNTHRTEDYTFACRDGEEYHMCGSPCEPTCETAKSGIKINCSRPCVPGCFCRNGLVRAKDNACIPPQDCFRHICKENEEFRECGSACGRNCTNFRDPIFCTKSCYPGCFCKHDFVRNSRGQCVHFRDCFREQNGRCPANEIYKDCVNPCNTCWDQGSCKGQSCRPGCDCVPGYYKQINGECVPLKECFPYSGLCEKNEEYTECVNPCNDCTSKGSCDYPYYYCEPGCDCKTGHFRNKQGICVPEQYCYTRACKENEHYLECGPSCPPTCENHKRVRSLPCTYLCSTGCFCRDNFVLGPDGKCISHEYCPDTRPRCPPDEQYYDCMPMCQTCDNYGNSSVSCYPSCRKGCFCKPGLYRRRDGSCVPSNKCPQTPPRCPPDEQYYDCMPTCQTCHNYGNSSMTCNYSCKKGCFCKPGFYRTQDGLCVPPNKCPPKQPVCPPNEQYYVCIPTCRNTCENFNVSSQVCSTECIKGCFCKDNMVRRQDGICVLRRDCPVRPCPAGEVFYQCLPTCRRTCETLNEPDVSCSTVCSAGCFCQPGFVKRGDGRCVRKEQCPQIPSRCPPGEMFYNCVPTCRNSCGNLNPTSPCPDICRPGCFCFPGFVRRHDGRCVRPQSCPIVCGVNEEFLSCGPSCPVTCGNVHEKLICPNLCVRACFCKKGFVRGPLGRCIPPRTCPRVPIDRPCGVGLLGCVIPRRGGDDSNSTEGNETTTVLTPHRNESTINSTEQRETTTVLSNRNESVSSSIEETATTPVITPQQNETGSDSTQENATSTTVGQNKNDNSTQKETSPAPSTTQSLQGVTTKPQQATESRTSITSTATSKVIITDSEEPSLNSTTISTINTTDFSTPSDVNITSVFTTVQNRG